MAKNKEEGVFEGVSYLNAHYYLILELEIGLADVSTLNFDQSFLQFNAKKKIMRRNLLNLNLHAEY